MENCKLEDHPNLIAGREVVEAPCFIVKKRLVE